MNIIRPTLFGVALFVAIGLPAQGQTPSQPIKMIPTNIDWSLPGQDGSFTATVSIQIQQPNPDPPPSAMAIIYNFQVKVPHVKTPAEAEANLREPVLKYLGELEKAAQDLPHP
jgi:hypothetical protein